MKKIITIIFQLFLTIFLHNCSDNFIEPPILFPEYDTIDETPAWSPDGKWIAYHHFNRDINDTIYPTGLYLVDTNGQNRRLLLSGNAYTPDWSPNSTKIVFSNGNIFLIDVNSMEINQLTNHGSDFFPNWHPDGIQITFNRSGTSDTVGTWVIEINNLNQTRLGFFSQLNWSSTGEKFIYSGKSNIKDSESQIWIANSDLMNQQKLTYNNFSYNRYPKWSSDNNKIVWEILRNNNIYSEVWIMCNDGTNQRKLTDGSYPSMSPDNENIVYSKPIGNKMALFIFNIHSQEIKQLTY